MHRTPRVLAVVSALVSTTLWIRLFWMNAAGPGGEAIPPALVPAILFPGVAWTGAVAALRGAPLVTLITGLIGFFPVGLYFLPAPGLLKLIGVAPLLMVGAGVWMVRELGREDGDGGPTA